MNKRTRIVTIASLVLLLISLGSVSAVLSAPSTETRADRIIEIAENAQARVTYLVDLVETDTTAMDMIKAAALDGEFYAKFSLCVEEGTLVNGVETTEDGAGWAYLEAAWTAVGDREYEEAIENAKEAMTLFREVYRSIHMILVDSDVETGELFDSLDSLALQEAIERSLARVDELQALIATEVTEVHDKLTLAEELLTEAKDEFLPDNIEGAKANLREANILISEVCEYLKEAAQELNPQRIRDYCEDAYQHREQFRDRFRGAWDESFDVNGFLQTQGYQNEDDFMTRFQEMIQNAEGTEDFDDVLEDLKEIGRTIRQMDGNLTEEMDRHRAQHGQAESGSGFGQNMGGYEGSNGFGQTAFGSGQ